MIAGRCRDRPSCVSAYVVFERGVFEVAEEFLYLGHLGHVTMIFRVEAATSSWVNIPTGAELALCFY